MTIQTTQEVSNGAMFDTIVAEKATGKYGSPIAAGLRLALNKVSVTELSEFAEKTGEGNALWGQFMRRRHEMHSPSSTYDFSDFVIDLLDNNLED